MRAAAWDARDALDALTVFYAAKRGWVKTPADKYTVGIRTAYQYGLEVALPVGPNTLGFSMKEK